jgi:hypothetical protein
MGQKKLKQACVFEQYHKAGKKKIKVGLGFETLPQSQK